MEQSKAVDEALQQQYRGEGEQAALRMFCLTQWSFTWLIYTVFRGPSGLSSRKVGQKKAKEQHALSPIKTLQLVISSPDNRGTHPQDSSSGAS